MRRQHVLRVEFDAVEDEFGDGTRMLSSHNHDISCVCLGFDKSIPVAGFFAMGEVGPVGGRNFLHGYTASVAVFRPR